MKLKSTLIFIFITWFLYPQDIKKDITTPDLFKLENYGFTSNGNFYLLSKSKNPKTKQKRLNFSVYDFNTFDEVFTYSPKDKFRIRNISPDGRSLIYKPSYSKFKMLNSERKVKLLRGSKIEGNLYREYSKRKLLRDSDLRVDFIEYTTKDAHYVIAPKTKQGINLTVLKRPFDFTTLSYSELNIPTFETDSEKMFWTLNSQTSDQLVFVAKELLDNNKDKYHVAVYNNDFVHLHKLSIEVSLPKDYFCYSNDGKNTSWYNYIYDIKDFTETGTRAISGATGNLFFDKKNKTFYAYGLYSDDEKSDRIIKPTGFYVYKFDWEGKLLWQQKHKVTSNKNFTKKQFAFNFLVKFYSLGNSLGLVLKPKEGSTIHFINIEESTGSITDEKAIVYSTFKRGYRGLTKTFFWSPYHFKKTNYSEKLNFDLETATVAFFNTEFQDYLKTLENKSYSFISKITDSGTIIAQADDKKGELKLIKFDW
ncbi:hypothetical protein [Hyunsoonleella ulvae]|uniref:hypothetical protein n=1 Tax=Hyunsoonleella ulvae TaxID=2799948 RepID=UPI00193A45B4|nr:hypothetical protein [Hyunsoonleella ulvae]